MPNKIDIAQLTIDRKPQQTNSFFSSVLGKSILLIALTLVIIFSLQANFQPAKQLDAFAEHNLATSHQANVAIKDSPLNENQSSDELITTHQVTSQKQQSVLDASGHIVARRIATVSSQITGKLNLLNIEEGQRVSKSQVLAELDDKQAQITYQLALAELAANKASLAELQLTKQHEASRLKRYLALFEKALISEQSVDDSKFINEKINSQVNNRMALQTLAQHKLALALYRLSQHKIRAPFDGVVISKNAQVGELISSGTSGGGFIRTGVGTIVDMSSLEIEVEVGESYINRVYQGQKTTATLDAYPNWQIASEVVAVIPTANRQKASIKVRVKLLELDEKILPDMGVKVSFLSQNG